MRSTEEFEGLKQTQRGTGAGAIPSIPRNSGL